MSYICNLCPRECGAVRSDTENIGGVCSMPYNITLARASKHMWEEPCISGVNGSGTVFFSGCQLKCVYCQNSKISHEGFGKAISAKELSEIFKKLECDGANNINLVSPTPFVPMIIESLKLYKPKVPIVYNSGGYERVETLEMLREYVDIYLLDYKYNSPERALKYSKVADYPGIAQKAILKAFELTGTAEYNSDGIMQRGTIVRHLLLPLGTRDAISVMKWIKSNCPEVVFSLMSQYVPQKGNEFPELSRKVTKREYEKVVSEMIDLGLDGYVQDLESADSGYTPPFDLTGIQT